MPFSWTEEVNRELIGLRLQGLSASQIGEKFGLTNHVVQGQLRRIKPQLPTELQIELDRISKKLGKTTGRRFITDEFDPDYKRATYDRMHWMITLGFPAGTDSETGPCLQRIEELRSATFEEIVPLVFRDLEKIRSKLEELVRELVLKVVVKNGIRRYALSESSMEQRKIFKGRMNGLN